MKILFWYLKFLALVAIATAQGQRVNFRTNNLVTEGHRFNIPSPVKQIGPTCWYATTFNMLNYYGLHQSFASYQSMPPPQGVAPQEWAWLRTFSDNAPTTRETKLMNMLIANKAPGFTPHFLNAGNFNRDRIIELLEDGPVYVRVEQHPRATNANFWDAAAWGSLAPGDTEVVYRTSETLEGNTPHAMLIVGYMRRDVHQLRTLAGANNNYRRFMGATDDGDGKTMELMLLDPNWPGHGGNRNNVVVVDMAVLQGNTNDNVRKLMYITRH